MNQHTEPATDAPATEVHAPRFAGTPIVLGDTTYIVPPLSIGQVRRLAPELDRLANLGDGLVSADDLHAVLTVIRAGVSRNYPNVTVEQLEELVDIHSVVKLVAAVAGRAQSPE